MGCQRLTYQLKTIYRAGEREATREAGLSRQNLKSRVDTGNYFYRASSRRDYKAKGIARRQQLARPSLAAKRGYYDPKVSVWLSVDPLADQKPSLTPYNFTENNPINLVDPDGRAPTEPPLKHGANTTAVSDATNIQAFNGMNTFLLKSNGDFNKLASIGGGNPYKLSDNKNIGVDLGIKVKASKNISLGLSNKGNPSLGIGAAKIKFGDENLSLDIDFSPFLQLKEGSRINTDIISEDINGDGAFENFQYQTVEKYQKVQLMGFTREERQFKDMFGRNLKPPEAREGVEIGAKKGPVDANISLKQNWKNDK